MLTLLINNTLVFAVFAIMLVQYVASHFCYNTTFAWSAHAMPWLIRHDPFSNSEAIVPLPPLSLTLESTEAGCDFDQIVFQC
jgi:hypothetical protein